MKVVDDFLDFAYWGFRPQFEIRIEICGSIKLTLNGKGNAESTLGDLMGAL